MKSREDQLHMTKGYKNLHNSFKKTFQKLNFRNRLQRTDMVASLIIGSCIDRNEQTNFGSGYVKNKELVNESWKNHNPIILGSNFFS